MGGGLSAADGQVSLTIAVISIELKIVQIIKPDT